MEPLEFAGSVGLALVLGVLIGFERQFTRHAAGLRTNALVAVGAALFVSLSRLMTGDPSVTRIASNVVVGVGFLGGGVILKEGLNIRGLTTAAGVWCSAAVGTLAGAGFPGHAAIGTGFVLVVLFALHPLDGWITRAHQRTAARSGRYRVRVTCREGADESVRGALAAGLGAIPGAAVTAVRGVRKRKRVRVTAEVTVCPENDAAVREVADRLAAGAGVLAAGFEKLPPTE